MVLMISKTYIIHIYRYEENEPDNLVGTVEDVEKGEKDKFTGMSGLWERVKILQMDKKIKRKRR